MKNLVISGVLFVMTFNLNAQNNDVLLPSEMPREQVIHHKAFTLSYNSSYVMPSWITYKITNSKIDKSIQVKEKYRTDPMVEARPAAKKDYKDGGYIMAQFVNYLDVSKDPDAVDETFYLTNITPMKLAFYTHVWLKTEDLIRLWLDGKDDFQIVCGPILTDAPFPTIGTHNVSVPKRFYKIVYDPVNKKAIAFIFKNGTVTRSLKSIATTVDEIEKITGIDFFPELDDETESTVEANVDYDFWNFVLEEKM